MLIGEDDLDLDGPNQPPTGEFVGTPVMWMTYTSGTTGRPKGIVRPTPQPAAEAPPQPMMQFWGFGADDVHLLAGPAYHTAPGAYAQMHLVEGAPVVIMDRFHGATCLSLIERHRVTNSHLVPANFVRILEVDHRAHDLSSIRKVLHGAAPCPEPVKRAIMDVFPAGTVWEYYGASEGMGTVISPDDWLAHPGSVGTAFPGLEIRILDDDGEPLPGGEIGTVYLSAVPGYAFAYHNAPAKTAGAWRDDVFTVGDLGWLDEDGYLYLADRRTDLILRGGVNVYPAEVESALAEHPEVVDCAVIGLPDERLGQRVHAIVERSRGSRLEADSLRRFLAERLSDFKVPATVEFVAELPREPNGKVRKAQLRDERS
ncbi:MAG: AMP-binding protein [Actinobacteria bacterium]|nr:AMP-binding protein [Actinomycetota bacterium]